MKQDSASTPISQSSLDSGGYIVPCSRWIRVEFNHTMIADTRRALLVRPVGRTPSYYFPIDDVRMDLLEESERVSHFPVLGATRHWHVRVGDRQAEHAAIVHTDLPETHQALRQHLSFKWSAMGAWFEEEEQVIVHPRDPYKRIDILQSSRKVRIELDGVVIASSESPVLLFETGLPTRFYLRRQDFNDDLLIPSDLTTGCPYKGFASYYSLRAGDRTHQDLIWCYESPLPESSKIKGLLSAFNERVDLYVDDELQPRPQTPWS